MKRGIVYTAVSPGYDKDPLNFTPEPDVGIELRRREFEFESEAHWNRHEKIMYPPRNCVWSMYLDGSLTPNGPINELVLGWLGKADMALFKHPHRTCAYAEIDACVARRKITAEEGEKARSHLMLAGFPRDFGLWACGMVARRSYSNALQTFVSPMWWELTRFVPRDQIWLPFVLWKLEKSTNRLHTIDADIFNNPWLKFRRHGA